MRHVVLFLAAVVFTNIASPVWCSDLLSTSDWRFLFVDDNGDAVNQALNDVGFFQNWMLPEYDEADVATYQWQDGTSPIGYGVFFPPDFFVTNLPSTVNTKGLFLRGTFDVPSETTGSFQLDLRTIGESVTAFFNGEEVSSEINLEFVPKGTGLTFNGLSPGTHTLAVAVESFFDHALFDARLKEVEAPFADNLGERTWRNLNERHSGLDWFAPENWLTGLPMNTDVAVFTSSNEIQDITLDAPSAIRGLRIEHFVRIAGTGSAELRIGSAGVPGSIVSKLRNQSLSVDISLGSDTTADIEGSLILQRSLNLNGHTLTKNGEGSLDVDGDGFLGNGGTVIVEQGILRGSGTIHGNVVATGGRIEHSDGRDTLTITGNFQGDVALTISRWGEYDAIAGEGGIADIGQLTVSARDFPKVRGSVFSILPGWQEINFAELQLPELSSGQWDTSRLDEGLLTLSQPIDYDCDFDESGFCDIADIDQLAGAIASDFYDANLDLNNDSQLDNQDVDQWLHDAAMIEGYSSAFLRGDADLDGDVDAGDLMTIGINWQQTDVVGWSRGDFHFDGAIDASDLNYLGINWQSHLTREPAPVPEPMGYLLLLFGMFCLLEFIRRCPSKAVTIAVSITVLATTGIFPA